MFGPPGWARLTLGHGPDGQNGTNSPPVIIRISDIISLTPVGREAPIEGTPDLTGNELWNAVEEAYKRCREACSDEEGNELLRWMTGEDRSHEGRWLGTYIMLKGDTRPIKVKDNIGDVVSLIGILPDPIDRQTLGFPKPINRGDA